MNDIIKKLENHFHIVFKENSKGFTHIEGENWFKIKNISSTNIEDYFDVTHWYDGSNQKGPWLRQPRDKPKDNSLFEGLKSVIQLFLSRGR